MKDEGAVPLAALTALQKKKNVNKLFASNPKSNFEIIFYLEKDKLFPPAKTHSQAILKISEYCDSNFS